MTGRFQDVEIAIGVIPPNTMDVPSVADARLMVRHTRTALRLAVGPMLGNPLDAVERGRVLLDALVGQVALRTGRLVVIRVLGERLERDFGAGRTLSL